MGEMRFDSDSENEFGAPPTENAGVDFTGKLVQWGVASNRKQAESVMIGLAVVVIIIAFLVYYLA